MMKNQNQQAEKTTTKSKDEKKSESGKPLDVLMHLSGFGLIGEMAAIAEHTSESAAGQKGDVMATRPGDQIKPNKAFRPR